MPGVLLTRAIVLASGTARPLGILPVIVTAGSLMGQVKRSASVQPCQ